MQRRWGKEKGRQPLERPSSPQSQPGTAVFLLAQQPNCSPAVPTPAPERRGGGIAASPSATLAAPFSPHPGTVQPVSGDAVQAAGRRRRRRMRGEHRPAAGALWQEGWVRRHRTPFLGTCGRVGGASGAGSIPSIPPASLCRQRGMGCVGKMAAPQQPGSVGARTAGLGEQPGPGGRCRDVGRGGTPGGLLPGSILSPHPLTGSWGSPRPLPSAAPGTTPSRGRWHWEATPPRRGTPPPAHQDWPVPQHCPAAAPL